MAYGFDPSKYPGPDPNGLQAGWSVLQNAISQVQQRKLQREMQANQLAATAQQNDLQRRHQMAMEQYQTDTRRQESVAATNRENALQSAALAAKAQQAIAGGDPAAAQAAVTAGGPFGLKATTDPVVLPGMPPPKQLQAPGAPSLPPDVPADVQLREPMAPQEAPKQTLFPQMGPGSMLQRLIAERQAQQPPIGMDMQAANFTAKTAPLAGGQGTGETTYTQNGRVLGTTHSGDWAERRAEQAASQTGGMPQAVAPFGDPKLTAGVGAAAASAAPAARLGPVGTAVEGSRKQADDAIKLALAQRRAEMQATAMSGAQGRSDLVFDRQVNREIVQRLGPVREAASNMNTLQMRIDAFNRLPPGKRGAAFTQVGYAMARLVEKGPLSDSDVKNTLGLTYQSLLERAEGVASTKFEGEPPPAMVEEVVGLAQLYQDALADKLRDAYQLDMQQVNDNPWSSDRIKNATEKSVRNAYGRLFELGGAKHNAAGGEQAPQGQRSAASVRTSRSVAGPMDEMTDDELLQAADAALGSGP